MADSVVFSRGTARRIVDVVRAAEAAPLDLSGVDLVTPRRPRCYRAFELTEALSGEEGATATVKWLVWSAVQGKYSDSGDTGEVTDTLGVCWGLEKDRGVAAWRGMANAAPIWEIVQNPGKPRLVGKLDADLTAGSSATMSIWEGSTLADSGRNVTVYDWFLPTGKKIASGARVAAVWNSGKWYVDTTDTCPT